jgi:hypothetical protein
MPVIHQLQAMPVNHSFCLTKKDACSMPIVTNADCDGKLPIATLPMVTV